MSALADLEKYFKMALRYAFVTEEELLDLEDYAEGGDSEAYIELATEIAGRAIKFEELFPSAKDYISEALGEDTVSRLYELYEKEDAERIIYDTYIEAMEVFDKNEVKVD